jgi:hypothetical protein
VNQTVTEGRRRQAGLLAAMGREWPMLVTDGAARRAWGRWAPELYAGGIAVDGPDELVPIIRHPGGRPSRRRARRQGPLAGLVPFVGPLAGLNGRYGPAPIDEAAAEILAAVLNANAPTASARSERHPLPPRASHPSSSRMDA